MVLTSISNMRSCITFMSISTILYIWYRQYRYRTWNRLRYIYDVDMMQNNYGVSRWWVNRYDIYIKYRWINSYSYWHWQLKFDTISKLSGISIYLKIPFKNVKWLNNYSCWHMQIDIDTILSISIRFCRYRKEWKITLLEITF